MKHPCPLSSDPSPEFSPTCSPPFVQPLSASRTDSAVLSLLNASQRYVLLDSRQAVKSSRGAELSHNRKLVLTAFVARRIAALTSFHLGRQMEYLDQYISLPPQQPSFQIQPPTPITSSMPQSTFVLPSSNPSSNPSPVAIPSSSRPTSRSGTPASSLSRSASRHHPYGSPASFASSYSERSFRSRSATSASERSEWESEASAYETDHDSRFNNSPGSIGFPPFDFPFPCSESILPTPPSRSHPVSPFSGDAQPTRIGKNGKPAKSHARKTAPGHIKRPPNAFILFRSHCCAPKADPSEPDPPGTAHARHLASLDINNSQHVSLIVSQLWRGLAPDEKAYWDQKAQDAKDEHQRLHPEYRYRPQQRAKETIRKRKKPDPKESREHRDACHEVARIVLEQEREPGSEPTSGTRSRRQKSNHDDEDYQLPTPPQPPTRGRSNLMEEVIDGGANKRASAKAKPKRASPRKTKSKAPVSDDSSPPSFGLPTPPALLDPFAKSSPGPFPSVLATTDLCEVAGASEQDNSPFAYMAQLNREATQSSLPSNPLFAVDPQFGLLSSTVDGQALHPLSRPASVSPATPFHSHNTSSSPVTAPPATAIGFSRPPSPTSDAIRQMQSYSLGGPSPPTRPHSAYPATNDSSASGFTFGTYSPNPHQQQASPAPLAQRRDIQFPPNLPLSALKHRRSTIRPGQQVDPNARGDLMLISPLSTTFNGRRQSLGWSSGLRRVSLGLHGAGVDENAPTMPYRKSSLSTGIISSDTSFETLTFPQDVLDSFPVENPFTDADFLAQFASSLPACDNEFETDRPDTASSSWSTDDDFQAIDRCEGGFPAGYFERRRSTLVASKFNSPNSGSPNYHVGSTDFFTQPQPPLSSSGSPNSQQAVPAFGSPEFGGSFQPFTHRQSIGSLLASSLSSYDQNTAPTFPSSVGSDHSSHAQGEWTASSMRDAALSVLHERRNPSQLQENAAECEYVLLPVEQLGDTDLMAKLHQ